MSNCEITLRSGARVRIRGAHVVVKISPAGPLFRVQLYAKPMGVVYDRKHSPGRAMEVVAALLRGRREGHIDIPSLMDRLPSGSTLHVRRTGVWPFRRLRIEKVVSPTIHTGDKPDLRGWREFEDGTKEYYIYCPPHTPHRVAVKEVARRYGI